MPFIDVDVMFVVDIYTQDIKNQSLSTDIRVYSTRKQLSHLVFLFFLSSDVDYECNIFV